MSTYSGKDHSRKKTTAAPKVLPGKQKLAGKTTPLASKRSTFASGSLVIPTPTATPQATPASGDKPIIGGTKNIQMVVMIGYHSRIRPDVNWVTMRLKEEKDTKNRIEHSFAENHVDYSFDLNSPYWRKTLCHTVPAGPGHFAVVADLSTEGPGCPKNENMTPDTYMMYRTTLTVPDNQFRDETVSWSTTMPMTVDPDGEGPLGATKILGHNGQHTFSLVTLGGSGWSQSGNSLPSAFPFQQIPPFGTGWADQSLPYPVSSCRLDKTVKNITISDVSTSNGTKDYFKFDPGSQAPANLKNPTIKFTINDEGDSAGVTFNDDFSKHVYRWRLHARNTNRYSSLNVGIGYEDVSNDDVVYDDVATTDLPADITLKLSEARVALDSPNQQLTKRGAYTFELEIMEYPNQELAQEALAHPRLGWQFMPGFTLDQTDLRSNYTLMPYYMPSPNGLKKGFDSRFEPGDDTDKINWVTDHYFRDTHPESATSETVKEVKVALFKADLSVKSEAKLANDINTPYLNEDVKQLEATDFDPDVDYLTVTTAKDRHASDYRDHLDRPLLAKSDLVGILHAKIEGADEHELLENGTLRACTGGIDDHDATDPTGQNDFQYRAHTRKIRVTVLEGTRPVEGIRLKLSFEDNKGHDYGDNRPDFQVKSARVHNIYDPFEDMYWKESLNSWTEEQGQATIWVKSSDVICQPTLIVQKLSEHLNEEPTKLGELRCDFADDTSFRNFQNMAVNNPLEDTGWLFYTAKANHEVDSGGYLTYMGQTTPAKIYMKFSINGTPVSMSTGNLQYVNGHKVTLKIKSLMVMDDTYLGEGDNPIIEITDSNRIKQYVTFQDGQLQGDITTSNDGSGQLQLKGQKKVGLVTMINLSPDDKSIWTK